MKCPACETESSADAVFCGSCGARLGGACAACGRANPPGSRFCEGCGARLGGQLPEPRSTDASHGAPLPAAFGGGRYRVSELLGQGGHKRVLRARDVELGRDVAVCVVGLRDLAVSERTRLQDEARALAVLGDHPHVLAVHDVGTEGDDFFFVTELMPGTLRGRLDAAGADGLPLDEALRVANQILAALSHVHGRGIVHRDVKPGNVYLTEDGSVKLGDFGIASPLAIGSPSVETLIVGTPAYMAPEQALGRAVDGRTDVYALGVVLYEMLTSRTPFQGDDLVAVIGQHIHTRPVSPVVHRKDLPGAVEAAVLGLLEKVPAARPASADAARQRLSEAAAAPIQTQPEQPKHPLDRLAAGVFVGRDAALERLRAACDAALGGSGQVELLVGEPGIGKTRTAEELATYASMRGARVLWGRGYEGDGAPAYWPWIQIVRAYVRDCAPHQLLQEMGQGAAAIADVVPEVHERLPGLAPPRSLEADEARFRLFDSIRTFLASAAAAQPLVLVLDDMHWIDRPSLLLLEFIASAIGAVPVLVLGTYRDVELGRRHPLEQTLAELSRGGHGNRVLLRGLTHAEVDRFLELVSGGRVPAALLDAVHRETEGNPFFVHEVVRLLQSDGRLERAHDVDSWDVDLPQGVRQVVGRRLGALSEGCNELLGIASVLGREFEVDVLTRLAERPADGVLEVLEEAVAAHIVVVAGPSRYRFGHALIRETLHDELRTTRRLRLHRRAGEVLEEERVGSLDVHVAELAYHFCEAASGGDVDKAVGYAVRAAERANAQHAFEEAANHYDRALGALEAIEGTDPAIRCDLLLGRARAVMVSGLVARAAGDYREAFSVARSLGDAERMARAALGWAISPYPQQPLADRELLDALEEAVSQLGDRSPETRAMLVARIGTELLAGEQNEQAEDLVRSAIALARSTGNVLAFSWTLAAQDALGWKNPEEGLRAFDEVIRSHEGAGNPEYVFRGYQSRIALSCEAGLADEIDSDIAALDRLAAQLDLPQFLHIATARRAARHAWRGELRDARREMVVALECGRRMSPGMALQVFGLQLWALRRFQGRLSETIEPVRTGLAEFPGNPIWRWLLACAFCESGQQAEARPLVDVIEEPVRPRGFDSAFSFELGLMADVCATLGEVDRAHAVYRALEGFGGRHLATLGLASAGSAARAKARLSATLGELDRAVAHFEEAVEVDRELGARAWLPRTQSDLAEVLLQRAGPGDRERALGLIDASLETSRELGLRAWLDRAIELRLAVQGVASERAGSSIQSIAASVSQSRPELGGATDGAGRVTLLFSDVEGFTRMTEHLGDRGAHAVMQRHHAIVRAAVTENAGREVELQGDGFLLAFAEAADGLRCAIAIQRAFVEHNRMHPDTPLRTRIGMHCGDAIRDHDRFFGRTVILASRIADRAAGEQILVSEQLRDLVEGAGVFRFAETHEVSLKGITDAQRVVEVEWRAEP